MKKLFVKAIEWLRSRVTALKDTRGVYTNVDDNADARGASVATAKSLDFQRSETLSTLDENLLKIKDEGRKVSIDEESINSKPSTLNQAKLRLTLPQVKELLCTKYELRYNLLTEQAEYRERGSSTNFRPVDKRVYMTWLVDIQAEATTTRGSKGYASLPSRSIYPRIIP